MNLVLHPSSGGHATSSYPSRRMKRPPTTAYNAPPAQSHYESHPSASTSAPVGYPPRQETAYPPRGPDDNSGYAQRQDPAGYSAPRPEGTGYPTRPEVRHQPRLRLNSARSNQKMLKSAIRTRIHRLNMPGVMTSRAEIGRRIMRLRVGEAAAAVVVRHQGRARIIHSIKLCRRSAP